MLRRSFRLARHSLLGLVVVLRRGYDSSGINVCQNNILLTKEPISRHRLIGSVLAALCERFCVHSLIERTRCLMLGRTSSRQGRI